MMMESYRVVTTKTKRRRPQTKMIHPRVRNTRRRALAPLALLPLSFCHAVSIRHAAAFTVNRNSLVSPLRYRNPTTTTQPSGAASFLLYKSNNPNDVNYTEHSTLLLSDGMLVTSETFQERYASVLPQWLLDRCAHDEIGWTHPTRIQQQALDTILFQKNDCIIQAETGSGKTLCYLLPCLAAVDPSRSSVQALIVVPTRELGLQVARVAKRLAAASMTSCQSEADNDESNNGVDDDDDGGKSYKSSAAHKSKIMIMSVLQGSRNRRQRAWAWAEPPHIVIGTPQELSNMVRLGGIKRYNSVKMVIVDEVDACLLNNAGSLTASLRTSSVFLHELLSKHLSPTYDDGTSAIRNGVDGVVASLSCNNGVNKKNHHPRPLSQHRQTIFCSATIPQPRHFLKQCQQNQWMLREPVHVCLRTGEQLMPPSLHHSYMVCTGSDQKLASLRRVVQKLLAKQQQQQQTAEGELPTSMKVLVFAEPHRPLEDMARVLASNVPAGVYWKEGSSSSTSAASPDAVFSVLRYEDSLSQRAAAMDAFRADDYRSMTTRTAIPFRPRVDENNSDISTPSSHSASSSSAVAPLRVMFSTDLAARGLDISGITHVIHFDLPPDADTYVHRAGRSGRFGRSGQVVSIVTAKQEFVLQRMANRMAIDIRCIARQKSDDKGNVMKDETD